MNTDYRRGYCSASVINGCVVVDHNRFDTPADIALAARECNYKAGNWNKSRLVNLGTLPKNGARNVTIFEIVPA